MPEPELFVAKFRDHPLGPERYAKDFRHNLTIHNETWWKPATEAVRREHFRWALSHGQYHYSTENLQLADLWSCDAYDAADRAILEQYAPVDFIRVTIGIREVVGGRECTGEIERIDDASAA